MNADTIMQGEDFKRCAAFHGHVCPGLSIGFRAAAAAMAWLRENRSADEELVAVVETDACSADAVQVLTGCTFGKGNFIHKDYGKMALTLFSRTSGEGVRVVMRPGAFAPDEAHFALLQKVIRGEAGDGERQRFEALHLQRSRELLEMPEERLFKLSPVTMAPPPRARIDQSLSCARCGEPTMASKLQIVDGRQVCRGCLAEQVAARG
ncbi:MAG: FmdE family protein [Desulfobacteraceae bacterium]|jgi:formylmethanofuran dehydrogenase subunit E